MNKYKKYISGLGVIAILLQQIQFVPHAEAQIPIEYKPNYKFAAEWDKVNEINSEISSRQKNGKAIDTFYFKELVKSYTTLFNYMPQKQEFKSTYKDCKIGAEELAAGYDVNKAANYYTNCTEPLGLIFKEITNSYTVKAVIRANPTDGSSPLTVTFDAKDSRDTASNTTIPSNNYFWYYTDTNGVEQSIGRGQIVNHTFKKEGNYVVHLTVRSANGFSEGIFDGSADININVGPQSAKIIVFANGKRLKDDIPVKFTTQEAADGLRIDGTATSPLGGRRILRHEWEIADVSSKEVIYKTAGERTPGSFRARLLANGEYNVKLTIQDNERNVVESNYSIIISDPIAAIKVGPSDGNTSSIFSFDASTSYSVQSTLKTYTWTITDEEGNEIANRKEKAFQQKISKPGTYRVRLRVLDTVGNENEEAMTLIVSSTPPVPQFTITPTKQRTQPSQFVLDASPTYDVDTANDYDALSYEWTFSNNDNVAIDKTESEGKKLTVSFREKGVYKATLTVKDNYGRIETVTKDINVVSALRPRINANPISAKLGESTSFRALSNQNVANYMWDFGDGSKRTMQEDRITYTYKKVGTYRVKLTVATNEGEENDVYTNVFIGEANNPVPAYIVTNQTSDGIIPEAICSDKDDNKYPAYQVNRYDNVTINGNESINIQGGKENLLYYFKPQGGDTYKRQSFQHRFDEVGCQFVDFTIEDVVGSKTASTRVWFDVRNARPIMNNVIMTFPQVGNAYGIGIGQNTDKELFKTDADPVVVKIDAVSAVDSDGSISKYKRYYYNVDDPQRLLEIKYTPGNTPSVFFSIPRISGEFRFGVEVYDNDGESTKSEEYLGNGPVLFFPPDSKNPDIPIVTLRVDRGSAKVGDEVQLEAIAKITSSRSDFATNRTFSYDFDGDGIRDLVTKDNKIKYIYKTPGSYTPRVKVTYRSRSGIAYGDTVSVEKGIKAGFLYGVIGNTLVVRDTSYGDIQSRKFCADAAICRNNPNWIIENQTYFSKNYEAPKKYLIKYDVQDKNGNTSSAPSQLIPVGVPLGSGDIGILTLPAADKDGFVSVGKNLENKILFYVGYAGKGDCYIDTDITRSSNGNTRPDQDRDIKECNTEAMIEYKPSVGSTIARIYYQIGNDLLSKDIKIQFLDYEVQLSPEQKDIYNNIDGIMNQIGDSEPDLTALLLQLRNAIPEGDDTSSYVLQLKDMLENRKDSIDPAIAKPIQELLARLENETTCSAEGCNTYKLSKISIINLFPTERKGEVAAVFEDIDNAAGDKTKIKQLLEKISALGTEEFNKKNLDDIDIEQLEAEVCNIVVYYEISGFACKMPIDSDFTGDIADMPTVETGGGSVLRKVLKVIGIIAGVLGLAFIILVIIFALKAKKKQETTV